MQPRQEVFDTYWKFAAKRQEIFFTRLHGESPPWTDDEILQNYKFTNAYRASDRVSQFLLKQVIYQKDFTDQDTIFRILLFRLFNKIATWKFLTKEFGDLTAESFASDSFGQALTRRSAAGETIFGGAFILSGQKMFGYDAKHKNYLALIKHMLEDGVAEKIVAAESLKEVFNILKSYPLLGDFLGYQLAIDINYSEVINFDEDSFTVAGPGAKRGIKKCFVGTGEKTAAEVIRWMVARQNEEFARLGIAFQGLWGRPLKAIDCQNLFCEVDKYARLAFPKLESNRSRIKSTFDPQQRKNKGSIDYFYPPKWGINSAVTSSLR